MFTSVVPKLCAQAPQGTAVSSRDTEEYFAFSMEAAGSDTK